MAAVAALLLITAVGCSIDRAGTAFDRIGPDARVAGHDGGRDGGRPPVDSGGEDARDGSRPIDGGREVDTGCGATRVACDPEGVSVLECTVSGSVTVQSCARGCISARCRLETDCIFSEPLDTLGVPGIYHYDTCGYGDDQRFVDMGSCRDSYPASGEDFVVRFDLPRRDRVRIDLRRDEMTALDPMLYLRQGGCDNSATQLACSDDADSTTRSSQIELELDAGDYFVVVDSYFEPSRTPRCGNIELELSLP